MTMRARFLALLIGACCSASVVAQPGGGLPLRNVVVELRQTDDSTASGQSTGVGGSGVTIGAGGQVRGNVGIGSEARSRDQARDTVQQVRVLNGGQASVRLAHSAPLQFVQVIWTAQGVQVLPATYWSESAQGFTVRPRWPGGSAPVTVEISAESGGDMPSRDGANERRRVLTTVQLPLDEWVTIASTADSASDRRSGPLSSRDVERSRRQLVQMRVSAP